MLYSWIQIPNPFITSCYNNFSKPPISSLSENTNNRNRSYSSSSTSRSKLHLDKPISILPSDVIQHIAAGQVLPDLQSVIQELVENSLDACATCITIHVNPSQSSLTVRDNGHGISHVNNLSILTKCNSTNKLNSLAQLQAGIHTLGFRGQALWALCTKASSLSIASRQKTLSIGYRVSFRNGSTTPSQSPVPVPMDVGTIVDVKNIQFHHNHQQSQSQQITTSKYWLIKTSLSYPNIRFRFKYFNSNLIWQSFVNQHTQPNQWIKNSLANFFRASSTDFRSANTVIPSVADLQLVIGLPSIITTTSKSWLITSINGRCVQFNSFAKDIRDNCNMKKGRYPVAFLSIDIDPKHINWNVSPRKTIIQFRDLHTQNQIQENVTNLVHQCLRVISVQSSESPPFTQSNLQSSEISSELHHKKTAKETPITDSVQPKQFRVIGQALNTYIIVEQNLTIMLIEQHVAEERILYESLMKDFSQSDFVSLPNHLTLQSSVPDEWIFTLTSLGFHVNTSQESQYIIDTVPATLKNISLKQLNTFLIRVCKMSACIKEAAAFISCQLALKNGSSLQLSKMQTITKDLLSCENPWTCPHGRPIIVTINNSQLSKLFGRSWSPERPMPPIDDYLTPKIDFPRVKAGTLQE